MKTAYCHLFLESYRNRMMKTEKKKKENGHCFRDTRNLVRIVIPL